MGIIASMVAMGEAAQEAATHAAEESGAVVEQPLMHVGPLRVHVYRRVMGAAVRTCWLIEHTPGQGADAETLHEHLVAKHVCYLPPRIVARMARTDSLWCELPCGCFDRVMIERRVRLHHRVRHDALVLRRSPARQ